MKKLKWVLIGLVVVVVAVVVTGYALLSQFDVEQYREVIQAEVKAATGRDLTLDGPVDLRISLTPAITAERVALGNAEWGSQPQMVSIERFEVQVALMPLLSDEVQVKRLVLVGPDILVETDAEGRSNLDFGPAAEEEGGAEAASELAVSVDEVKIENGRLIVRDGAAGTEMTVELDSLTASAKSLSDPIALAMAGRYNDLDFSVDGSFGSFRELNAGPFPVELTAEAAGATVEVRGSVAQPLAASGAGQGVDLTVAVKGDQIADLATLAGAPVPALGAYAVSAHLTQDGTVYRVSDIDATLGPGSLSGVAALASSPPLKV